MFETDDPDFDVVRADSLFRGWVHFGTRHEVRGGVARVVERFGDEFSIQRAEGVFRVTNMTTEERLPVRCVGDVVFGYRRSPSDDPTDPPTEFHPVLAAALELKPRRVGSFGRVVLPATLAESAENIADRAHFPVVHGSAIASMAQMQYSVENNTFSVRAENTIHMMKTRSVFEIECVDAFNSIAVNDNRFAKDWYQVTMAAPLGIRQVEILIYTSNAQRTPLASHALNSILRRAALKAANEDRPIWTGKTPLARPILSDADGPIMQFRRWHAQFREPRARHQYDPELAERTV